ncbi:hypothetical protein FRC08_000958 [Ceratobasidium sp. 394]|nr:hypothetical protein FRC08_000958 [Ceratobasidium sp. 394]
MSSLVDSQVLSPCYRVFTTSELVWLIYSFSDKRDWANLLYLSRRIFEYIAPTLWGDVDVKSLLLLIPGTTISEYDVHQPVDEWVEVPAIVNITRFKVYADFVKVARMHMPWSFTLLDETALPTPLLPNLQRLIFSTNGLIITTNIDWVSKLLTPDLLAFELYSIPLQESDGEDLRHEHPWMKRERCFELIGHISCKCSRLETLRIFLGEPDSPGTAIDGIEYNGMTSLKHLRTLALGTIDIDQDLFLALVQLPHLGTLSLHTDNSRPKETSSDPIDIPDDSFLTLRHLALYGLSESSIQRICALPPLFRYLFKASIVSPDYGRDSRIADQRAFSRSIAQCFGRGSPHLTDLTIFCPGLGCLVLYLPGIIDIFKQLPLQRLRLDKVRLKSWGDIDELDSDDSDDDEEIGRTEVRWRDFLTTMPHIKELHLDVQILMSSHLPVFASTLPNLQLLVLGAIMFDETEKAAGQAAAQPITIQCSFYGEPEGQDGWTDISRVVRYLHAIWPNAYYEVDKSKSWLYNDPLDEGAVLVARFNEALEVLRSGGK